MKIVLHLVVALAAVLLPSVSQADGSREVALADVEGGQLLWRTDIPGQFQRAPIQETDVQMTIRGVLVEAVVIQSFTNPTDHWLEGVYAFPLPTDAAVHGMRLEIGDRVLEGRFQEREQARATYERAAREGRKASLVEQQRPNLFTTSVANVGPSETVTVRLEYQETLRWADGVFELRFPMVIGPRYIPGRPVESPAGGSGWAMATDEIPDAPAITPPVLHPSRGAVNPVTLTLTLDAGLTLAQLTSPSHDIVVDDLDGRRRRIRLPSPVPADRDFVLRWAPVRGQEPRAAVFTEALDDATYVMAMVMPPAPDATAANRLPREVVLVIDTSGSMAGASILQAQAALVNALARLETHDWFNVIAFNSTFRRFQPSSVPAVPSQIERATAWVEHLGANGGTEMLPALQAALHDPPAPASIRQVVFVTDGCVGNEHALFGAIERELSSTRLFTVGIGSAPNAHFMERAAAFGRGTATFIGDPTEVESTMDTLLGKLEQPVMTDIELRWPDPEAEAWPDRTPDLYAGEPVVVAARMAHAAGEIGISGVRGDMPWSTRIPLDVGLERAGIDRLWARRAIANLMDQKARGETEDTIRPAVVTLALRHGLLSRYTSLVAVDITPTRPKDESLGSAAVPTNLPAGWKYEKVFGGLPKGGTASRLLLLIATALALLAVALWRVDR